MRLGLTSILVVFFLTPSVIAGQLETVEFDSKALGRPMKLNVLLPDGYGSDAERRYPVVYLLHGYGGDYAEWQRVGVEAESTGLPVIIVMPEGDRSFYVNHHESPENRWEDYITRDVIGYVDAKYRTRARRDGRGISGLSMGGFGAVVLGLSHPELFASVVSHSGALGVLRRELPNERIASRIREIFGPEGSEVRKKYELVGLVEKLPDSKRPHIYIDCGSRDRLLESNREFVRELAKLEVRYEYREVPGQHNFAYWKRNVRYSLTRQLEALDRAQSSPAGDAGASLAGLWDVLVDFGGNEIDYTLRIRRAGDKLEAVLISPRSGEHKMDKISFKDGKLHMEIERDIQGNRVNFVYDAELTEKGLAGKVVPEGLEDLFSGTWKATKKKSAE
ncbi:MAG: alpha/beta hydrolase-fold protein [Planctomycetota bacterium]|nr:alpha/beta hydrolase-fold protein [Planctomycetota bacterium]